MIETEQINDELFKTQWLTLLALTIYIYVLQILFKIMQYTYIFSQHLSKCTQLDHLDITMKTNGNSAVPTCPYGSF